MSRILSILIILVLAGLAYVWFVPGPSILLGGPSKADIVAVTRGLVGPSAEADGAVFTPKGLCSEDADGSFACIVEMTVGGKTESAVTVLKKDASGAWVASY